MSTMSTKMSTKTNIKIDLNLITIVVDDWLDLMSDMKSDAFDTDRDWEDHVEFVKRVKQLQSQLKE